MERFILFPINEIRCFNEGKQNFNNKQYQKAIDLFEKAKNLKYFKKECIKFLIDCHIELHHFEEVYKMIENEFVDKNVDEEFLLKKYLYTMILEEQYVEASELIHLYRGNKKVSVELKHYLDELMVMIDEKKGEKHHDMMQYFLSDAFEDHIQIILNLDKLDVDKYELEINQFLSNPSNDVFIKYNLLKYLIEHQLISEVSYRNYYEASYIITKDNFVDLLNSNVFLEPADRVLKQVEGDFPYTKEFIKHIWMDFCMKHYPHLIKNLDLASAVLHCLLLKSIHESFDVLEISKLYHIDSNRIFYYFKL